MKQQTRKAGVLLPIFSLPSKFGIGSLGNEAYRFVDFLKSAGQSYWQVLPIGPTGFGDSPYQSFSAYAGNPYFIDIPSLEKQNLITETEMQSAAYDSKKINYARLFKTRIKLLRHAAERFDFDNREYLDYVRENKQWLHEYALYMAIKDNNNGQPWFKWDTPLKNKETGALQEAEHKYKSDIEFHQFLQYLFYKQWHSLKKYANKNGIGIIGDMPIYISMDSAESYFHRELFQFDENGNPFAVAGCPPDDYATRGQIWGNPLYDWDYHAEQNYEWWIRRFEYSAYQFDVVRIDHFRGFESYYSIPAGSTDATNGRWKKGCGMKLFKAVQQKLGDIEVVAEDLGFLTPAVQKFLKQSGFPGMKVLQFAFSDGDAKNPYLPHNYTANCVVYTGTHDNTTTRAFYDDSMMKTKRRINAYLNTDKNNVVWAMIRAAYSSVAKLAIIPMQDLLELDESARMNTPSMIGGNWQWQMKRNACSMMLARKLHDLCKIYDRLDENDNETN